MPREGDVLEFKGSHAIFRDGRWRWADAGFKELGEHVRSIESGNHYSLMGENEAFSHQAGVPLIDDDGCLIVLPSTQLVTVRDPNTPYRIIVFAVGAAALAAGLLLASCASVDPARSAEGSRAGPIAQKVDKPRGRSPGWIREHCPDCGGNGPRHVGMQEPRP